MNAPRCPVHSYHRDGPLRRGGNQGNTLGHEPNRSQRVAGAAGLREPSLALDGAADHWSHRQDEDYYSQPGLLFRLMNPQQRKVLFENTARAMGDAAREIKLRHINDCLKSDPAYGEGVATALGIPTAEVSR